MSRLAPPPEQGSLVEVRQRRFVVVDVRTSSLPHDPLRGISAPQHVVALSSVEDDAFGEELEVIWELEPGAQPANPLVVPTPDGFDDPAWLDAFLDAARWGAAASADRRLLLAPFRSGIEVEDYQLDPVARAIQMPRVNLLIADDVGLGKTIEAGLVTQELILRHRARTVLVVCPAALQIQWRDQMRDKFGLEFRIIDAEQMRDLRRTRGLHVNPWQHFPRLITSIDYLKRDRPLRLFRDLLPLEGESPYPRRFDLLIVDEAHNIAPSGRNHYALDSRRTQAIRMLSPHFEHKLFLSATPHNGYPESFSALLELLDDQRFARGVAPGRAAIQAVMVRRLKSELPPRCDGTPRFPERVLEALSVAYTPTERAAYALLRRYAVMQLERAPGAERLAVEFVIKLLKKRFFSSPAAFARTLTRHRQTLLTPKPRRDAAPLDLAPLRRQIERMEEDFGDEEAFDEATEDTLTESARAFHPPTPEALALLDELRDWAESACHAPDSKALALIAWLKATLLPDGSWSERRVIIFTEYRDTQKWLFDLLVSAGLTGQDRVMFLFGGMSGEERETVKAAFQADPKAAPVRILLATDAASEGIDLQNYCSRLIHYEIPWNPNRMEQRNGRVDRHGQHAPVVDILHFVGSNASTPLDTDREREDHVPGAALDADLEFLYVVARKVQQIREDLGSAGSVIARQVEETMLGARARVVDVLVDGDRNRRSREMLRFEHDLHLRIKKLYEQYHATRRDLRLDPANIAAVVRIALEIADQPPLRERRLRDAFGRHPEIAVFDVPPLRGSWEQCLAGLAHPLTGVQRPITFDPDAARGRDDVVLAHLHHRLVQVALRLLRAEVWSPWSRRRLHRVAARLVPGRGIEAPMVCLFGRLMVLGGDQARLHEEIIVAAGALHPGPRFDRLNAIETKRVMDLATGPAAPETVCRRLAEQWDRIQGPLMTALDARANDRFKALRKSLEDRAAEEADAIRAILEELQRAIAAELATAGQAQQLTLFAPDERDQFARNQEYLRLRLDAIPAEIARETVSLTRRYADPRPRLFPLAILFLVPEHAL